MCAGVFIRRRNEKFNPVVVQLVAGLSGASQG